MTNEELIRSLHILLAKVHLWQAGEVELRRWELDLILKLGEWFEMKGSELAYERAVARAAERSGAS